MYKKKGREVYWVWDGQQLAMEFSFTGSLSYRFLYGPGVDQILTQGAVWHLGDHLGTTRDLIDEDGDHYQHFEFDSYGRLLNSPTFSTLLLFAGREYDIDTQMYFVRARWYDPNVGRWISEDPIGFAGGDTNLSRYVGNSPLNYTDPSGLFADSLPDVPHRDSTGRIHDDFYPEEIPDNWGPGDIEDALCEVEGDLEARAEQAKKKGGFNGGHGRRFNEARRYRAKLLKRLGLIPGLGIAIGVIGISGKVEAKGFGAACFDELLDQIPYVEWIKGGYEIGSGNDLFPDLDPNNPPRDPDTYKQGGKYCCFEAGTHVWTPNGARKIEDIRAGDTVLALFPDAQTLCRTRVTALDIHPGTHDILTLQDEKGGIVEVTDDHYFSLVRRISG